MAEITEIGLWQEEPVQAVVLTRGDLRLKVLTWGARLAELHVPDARGTSADIALGFDRVWDWFAHGAYIGATCGRYANRIAGAGFVLDGRPVRLVANEGDKQLHGGPEGFHRKNWRIERADGSSVTLSATAADGEMGYPGRLGATCTYRIDDNHRLWIEMTARTDAPTVVNLVNHTYFNMAGHGSGPILDQHLRLNAAHYTPVGPDLIPTGEVLAVAGTPFDFTVRRPIGHSLPGPGGFDHNFCLSDPSELHGGIALIPCAEALDPTSGRRMRIWTDQPGVQFYTGAHLARRPGKAGAEIAPFGGFALETQRFPDSPNRAHFPSARLDPGQTYRHHMMFDFTPG